MTFPIARGNDAVVAWGAGHAVELIRPGAEPRGTCFRCFKDDLETIRKQGASGALSVDVVGGPGVHPPPPRLPSPPPPWSPPPLPSFAVPMAGTLTPPVSLDLPLPPGDPQSPPRPIAWPSSTSPPADPDSLIFACLSHFWSDYHKLYPLVHRASFEAAFAPNAASPLYGTHPPLALVFAMAAIGARTSNFGLSEAGKATLGRAYCERSRDVLLAGYFDANPLCRPISDIEALQTLILLLQVLLGVGILGETAAAMLREAVRVAGRLLDLDALQALPAGVP
ncbi:hypothetical protein DFJ74DRAFT_275242 [Hyaloraphidium curvatum]|nr:hypothetical protein DFJ74DRAFT_275242 [Hyaloraphidium curvatum]